jgi:hypothetical protein
MMATTSSAVQVRGDVGGEGLTGVFVDDVAQLRLGDRCQAAARGDVSGTFRAVHASTGCDCLPT